jgi:hypothetical protein
MSEQDQKPKSPGEEYFYTPPAWVSEVSLNKEEAEARRSRQQKEKESK